MQYNQLRPFMNGLLKDVLNDNCIHEIVAFTVGQVMRFDVETLEGKVFFNVAKLSKKYKGGFD